MLYNWQVETQSLNLVCTHHGHVLALSLAVQGDSIIVGDLMKSICILLIDPTRTRMDEIARDYESNWMTAVYALDDDLYIGAENHYNLFALKKWDSQSETECKSLEPYGRFHLGDMVNRFRQGH